MTLVEVQVPQENPTPIPVAHEPIDYAAASRRYHEEANELIEGSLEHRAKLDTANYLSKKALEVRIKEYSGRTDTIQSR